MIDIYRMKLQWWLFAPPFPTKALSREELGGSLARTYKWRGMIVTTMSQS